MVFHGDYEIEFEIYENPKGTDRRKLLGHMAGVDAFDAKTRWVEAHEASEERYHEIYALYPQERWQ